MVQATCSLWPLKPVLDRKERGVSIIIKKGGFGNGDFNVKICELDKERAGVWRSGKPHYAPRSRNDAPLSLNNILSRKHNALALKVYNAPIAPPRINQVLSPKMRAVHSGRTSSGPVADLISKTMQSPSLLSPALTLSQRTQGLS